MGWEDSLEKGIAANSIYWRCYMVGGWRAASSQGQQGWTLQMTLQHMHACDNNKYMIFVILI